MDWTVTVNKRTFIKLIAWVAASPIFSPLLSWAAKKKLTNWAGNLEYSTDRLYPANSLEEITSYVKKQKN